MSEFNNDIGIANGEELAKANDIFLPGIGWENVDTSNSYLDVTTRYDSPRYSLRINDVPCAPVGGLHVITGQPGNGKTNAQAQLIAAYLGDTSHGITYNLQAERPNPRVLYVDTEMEKENTMMVNLRVCAMTGREEHTKYDDFDIMVLRNELSAEDRWLKILKGIYEKKPQAVFIDGMIDIVADFNDNKQCQEIIFKCMALATYYDINLWTTIHQNPGTTKMTGHAGSFLERKATDIFQITKDKSTGEVKFTIEQTKARGKDVPKLEFRMTTMGGHFKFAVPETINQDATYPTLQIARILLANEFKIQWPQSKNQIKKIFPSNQQKNIDEAIANDFLVAGEKINGGYPGYNLDKEAITRWIDENYPE